MENEIHAHTQRERVGRETDRQAERRTERQVDREKDTEREKNEKETELYNSLSLKRRFFGQCHLGRDSVIILSVV